MLPGTGQEHKDQSVVRVGLVRVLLTGTPGRVRSRVHPGATGSIGRPRPRPFVMGHSPGTGTGILSPRPGNRPPHFREHQMGTADCHLAATEWEPATVRTTSGNTHKKAGALNYALERVLPQLQDDDAVLVQDADSVLDPDFVAVAVAVAAARLDDGYAAVAAPLEAWRVRGPAQLRPEPAHAEGLGPAVRLDPGRHRHACVSGHADAVALAGIPSPAVVSRLHRGLRHRARRHGQGPGINILYSLLIAFTLIGVGFAVTRCIPKRHTS